MVMENELVFVFGLKITKYGSPFVPGKVSNDKNIVVISQNDEILSQN